jgi:mRNA-degrading endonuclease RelE of RelBE toxin-antitoxin system
MLNNKDKIVNKTYYKQIRALKGKLDVNFKAWKENTNEIEFKNKARFYLTKLQTKELNRCLLDFSKFRELKFKPIETNKDKKNYFRELHRIKVKKARIKADIIGTRYNQHTNYKDYINKDRLF